MLYRDLATTNLKVCALAQFPRRSMSKPIILVMAVLLAFPSGCSPRGDSQTTEPSHQFQEFLSSHTVLSDPPGIAFRVVYMQKQTPSQIMLTWGKVKGFNRIFSTAVLNDEPNFFPTSSRIDDESMMDSLSEYLEIEKLDWINGGNESYGFGVAPNDQGFLLNGATEMPRAVVSSSCVPFASVFDSCLISELENKYTVESFGDSKSKTFPNSIAVKVKHRTKEISKTLYFDPEFGFCTGTTFWESDQVESQFINRYRRTDSSWQLVGTEAYFRNSEGDMELERYECFLEWQRDESLLTKKCFLTHYDLPEPIFMKRPNRRWLYLSLAGIVISTLAIWIVVRSRRQSQCP